MTGLVYALGMVLFLLGVAISIALHEVGHMVPAKKFGVRVTQYFVGFGKTVWSTKRGETEYGLKMFPLGGFIKMIGMLPPEKRDAQGRVKGFSGGALGKMIADARAVEYEHITPEDESRLFYRLPWWKKVIVMAGGPMMNVFLAVLILGSVFMLFGIAQPGLTVSKVAECVVPATAPTTKTCPKDAPGTPAMLAGFRPGDRILSIDGTPMKSWDQFTETIRDSAHKQLHVVVLRDDHRVTLTPTPTDNVVVSRSNPDQTVHAGFVGVTPAIEQHRESLGYTITTMGSYTKQTGIALWHFPSRLVNVAEAAVGGDRDPNSPISVIGAGRVAGEVASNDSVSAVDRLATLLQLLGIVNLFVALFNFVPLLPLDGGHIAGALYEAVRRGYARLRRRPDPGYADVAQMLPIAYVAASVLILMGVLLIWADIVNPIRLTG